MELKQIFLDHGIDYDYDLVLDRFCRNEALLQKFLLRFVDDPTFEALRASVATRATAEIERNAHTMKGLSANLGFTALSACCAQIVDAVRNQNEAEIPALFACAQTAYEDVLACICKIG